jgi:tetratricopeptide (TPR) repeat protein
MIRADFIFMVLSLSRIRIVLLAAALTVAAAPAFPEPPKSHDEALTALASTETAVRLEAIVWLANYGGVADASLLHERLRDESAIVRDYAEQGLWALWTRSGDAAIDKLMAREVGEMDKGQHKAAIATFAEVVKRKPEFAEGWNKRATVYYLAGEYKRSIADCEEVLKRDPRHFGALSGLGQIYFQLQLYDQSLAWFRKALDVNPNMPGVESNIKRIEALKKERRGTQI